MLRPSTRSALQSGHLTETLTVEHLISAVRIQSGSVHSSVSLLRQEMALLKPFPYSCRHHSVLERHENNHEKQSENGPQIHRVATYSKILKINAKKC